MIADVSFNLLDCYPSASPSAWRVRWDVGAQEPQELICNACPSRVLCDGASSSAFYVGRDNERYCQYRSDHHSTQGPDQGNMRSICLPIPEDLCGGNKRCHSACADGCSPPIVENLVGYAKADLMVPQAPFGDFTAANAAAREWCAEVNGAVHSEICAVPAERLLTERELLAPLPSLRASIGKMTTRKVDRLSCVRFASARYSVPVRLIGTQVRLRTDDGRLLVIMTGTGEVVAEHTLVAPGEASVRDKHYGGPRPDTPRRAVRPKTAAEKAFCSLGPVAGAFIPGAAAAGATRLPAELAELNTLRAAHGDAEFLAALDRAVAFCRWRAADIRAILAAGAGVPRPKVAAGDALNLDLPAVPVRPLADYAIGALS